VLERRIAMTLRPLEGLVEQVFEFEGATVAWYLAKGHVDKGDFVCEIDLMFDGYCQEEDIKHAYARNVPVGPEMPGATTLYLSEPDRGAYPVTYVEASKVQLRG
jgi:hypothetical protein